MSEELLTAAVPFDEAALRLGISRDALRKRISRGQVKASKVAGQWRVILPCPDNGQTGADKTDGTDSQTRQTAFSPDKEAEPVRTTDKLNGLSGQEAGLEPDRADKVAASPDSADTTNRTDGLTDKSGQQSADKPDQSGQVALALAREMIESQREELARIRSELEQREERLRLELAAKEDQHQSEISYYRSQLAERADELRRKDVILQTIATRVPQLPAPAEETMPERPAAADPPGRKWWQLWRRN